MVDHWWPQDLLNNHRSYTLTHTHTGALTEYSHNTFWCNSLYLSPKRPTVQYYTMLTHSQWQHRLSKAVVLMAGVRLERKNDFVPTFLYFFCITFLALISILLWLYCILVSVLKQRSPTVYVWRMAHTRAVVNGCRCHRRFWHVTLRLCSVIRRHHPSQRAVLSQICWFREHKVVLFQILLDGAEPHDAGTTWLSSPVCWRGG